MRKDVGFSRVICGYMRMYLVACIDVGLRVWRVFIGMCIFRLE